MFHISLLTELTALTHKTMPKHDQGESSCPDFNTYMELCEIIRENDPMVDTIILTSEDARFIEPRHAYTTTRGNRKPWRFILNSRDVMQGGGTMKVITNNTVHEVFMSFFTTMQMQVSKTPFKAFSYIPSTDLGL